MDLQVISQLINMVKASGLSAVEVEDSMGFRIRLENDHVGLSAAPQSAAPDPTFMPVAAPATPASMPVPTSDIEEKPAEDDYIYVKCPMVGVFCSLEKVGKKPLKAGDKIEPDMVVCAVEAMKMVCDVQSEVSGVYVDTLVQDGDQVEYGQNLLRLKKA